MNILEKFRLDDRVAIVTGGGRGLGKSMALALAEAGAHVMIADLDIASAEEASAAITALGRRSVAMCVDVSDYDQAAEMARKARSELGKIDILVNNAGIVYTPQEVGGSASIPLEQVSRENWDHVVKVNLNGVFYCSQHVGRVMLVQGSGNIINIASMSAFVSNLGRSNNAYCASKAGVVMFTRQLAGDWAEKGVRVNAIAPGYMRTEIGAGPLDDPVLGDLIRTLTPMRRPGVPDDLKGLVVFLASDASAYLTGHAVVIDGGYTVW